MAAYYNEHDPYAAAWLRNLIAAGHIAPGDVDERSIKDVLSSDLDGYTQCHFFAGVGVWSYALRRSGWPDDRPVWTGSCPCQPFSAAGKGLALDDERHLWPHWFHLIGKQRPAVVFGEQVASSDGLGWLDLVRADMEGAGYAIGAVDLCAAGVGAPHIRQRLWFVAEDGMGNANDPRLERQRRVHQAPGGRFGAVRPAATAGESRGLADAEQHRGRREAEPSNNHWTQAYRSADQCCRYSSSSVQSPGPTNGHWRDADWLFCRDGKWRPVEASPQPLADGSAESLGRVRPEVIAKIEEEINASAMESEIRSPEVLRALQETLGAQAGQVWSNGRVPGLSEAPFLLSFLRQLQEQGWDVTQGRALHGSEAERGRMRVLRDSEAVASSSHKRKLVGQPPRESSDPVHFLSSLLARHSQEAWAHNYETYAEVGFPIGTGSPSRVGRLRAYGNAIVAEAAGAMITAYMQARGEG